MKSKFDNVLEMIGNTPVLKINNIERIPAIYGKDLEDIKNISIFGKILRNKYKSENIHSQLGCFLSHIKALRRAKELNLELVCIIEDDFLFDFAKVWKKPLLNILEEAPEDWEIINMTNFIFEKTFNYKDFYISSKEKSFSSTMFYIINEKGIDKILKLFERVEYSNKKKHRPVSDMFLYENTNSYTLKNPLVPSDICKDDSNIDEFTIDWRCYKNAKNLKNLFVK